MNDSKLPAWWVSSEKAWIEIERFFNLLKGFNKKRLFEEKNWRVISEGRSNLSYCLSLKRKRYFVQIINREKNLFLPYERTIYLEQVIDKQYYNELSSFLVDTLFQSDVIKVQEWFDAKPLCFDLNVDKHTLKALANALASLHQIKTNKLQDFDLRKHLEKYKYIALENKKNSELREDIINCYEKAIKSLKTYQPSTLCHYDLNLNNILIDDSTGVFKIIDWEYLCIGDPLLDITALVINLKLSNEQESYFFQCYGKALKNTDTLCQLNANNKVKDMKILNKCILELWEYGQ